MVAELAFDGNKTQILDDALSCSHTYSGKNNWLKVDLERKAWIRKLIIYNRIDGNTGDRFKNVDVFVADSLDMMQNRHLCVHIDAITAPNGIQTFQCNDYIFGRYVRFDMYNDAQLNLCEVEVMGTYYFH